MTRPSASASSAKLAGSTATDKRLATGSSEASAQNARIAEVSDDSPNAYSVAAMSVSEPRYTVQSWRHSMANSQAVRRMFFGPRTAMLPDSVRSNTGKLD